MLLDGIHAKEFIFKGLVKFQSFVFTNQSISLKNECESAFQYYPKFWPITHSKEYKIECNYYLELHKKILAFELVWLWYPFLCLKKGSHWNVHE